MKYTVFFSLGIGGSRLDGVQLVLYPWFLSVLQVPFIALTLLVDRPEGCLAHNKLALTNPTGSLPWDLALPGTFLVRNTG